MCGVPLLNSLASGRSPLGPSPGNCILVVCVSRVIVFDLFDPISHSVPLTAGNFRDSSQDVWGAIAELSSFWKESSWAFSLQLSCILQFFWHDPGCKDFGQGCPALSPASLSGALAGCCCIHHHFLLPSLLSLPVSHPSGLLLWSLLPLPTSLPRAPTPLCWTRHCLQPLVWVLGVPRHRGLEEAVIYVGLGLALFRGWGGWAGMLAGAVFSGAGSGLVGQQCLRQEQGGGAAYWLGLPGFFPSLLGSSLVFWFWFSPLLSGELRLGGSTSAKALGGNLPSATITSVWLVCQAEEIVGTRSCLGELEGSARDSLLPLLF